jgi:hypothetical protein
VTGDLSAWGRFSVADLELGKQIDSLALLADGHTFLGAHYFYSGDWTAAADELELGVAAEAEAPGAYGGNRGAWLLYSAEMGNTGVAKSWIDSNWTELARVDQPNAMRTWVETFAAVEALWLMGDRDRCAHLLPAVKAFQETGTLRMLYTAGSIPATIAVASAAAGDWDAFERLTDEALLAESWSQTPAWAVQRQTLATVFLARDQTGDRERARQILTDVLASYEHSGMPRHVTMAKELLAKT